MNEQEEVIEPTTLKDLSKIMKKKIKERDEKND